MYKEGARVGMVLVIREERSAGNVSDKLDINRVIVTYVIAILMVGSLALLLFN
jgi:hypothetical protein